MESRYNIYFAGEVLEGQQVAQVREKLRALFKASDEALDKLFSGREQLVKRECDKATALKYKQAMERAGACPVIRVVRAEEAPAPAVPPPSPERKLTAAERIAAVAAAPDITIESKDEPAPAPEVDEETGWYLEPVGSDLLKPEERRQPVVVDIDVSSLKAIASEARLAPDTPPPPAAPDTSHLALGAAGDTIPTLPSQHAPLNPNTDNIGLSPEGTDFTDCAPPPPNPPAVDLSSINLAPEGSDVLEEKYRRHDAPLPPDTEHILLQD